MVGDGRVSDLGSLFGPELVAAIERLVDERLEAKLAELGTGSSSPWLSISDAAAYLGVSERTIERHLKAGRLRSSYVGRRRLLRQDDLDVATSDSDGLR
jgi:excisionase family DNA binding protein